MAVIPEGPLMKRVVSKYLEDRYSKNLEAAHVPLVEDFSDLGSEIFEDIPEYCATTYQEQFINFTGSEFSHELTELSSPDAEKPLHIVKCIATMGKQLRLLPF